MASEFPPCSTVALWIGEGRRAVKAVDQGARVKMVVAAADSGATHPVFELEVGGIGARHRAGGVPYPGHAPDATQHTAADGTNNIELVRPLPPEDAVSPSRGHLVGCSWPIEPVHESPTMDHTQPPQLPGAGQFPDFLDARLEAVLDVHPKQHPIAVRRGDHLVAVFQRTGHGFFDEHVLAML